MDSNLEFSCDLLMPLLRLGASGAPLPSLVMDLLGESFYGIGF
jgi:hypothetical protein